MSKSTYSANPLRKLFAGETRPLYVLDGNRVVTFVNRALCAWTGWRSEQLLGCRCDFQTAESPPSPAAELCPPPEALAGWTRTADLAWTTPAGALRGRADFVRFQDDKGRLLGVLVLISPGDAAPAANAPPPHSEAAANVAPNVAPREASRPAAAPGEFAPDVDWRRRLQELRRAAAPNEWSDQFVGQSPAWRRVREQIRLARQSAAPVLVQGPPGSQRELVARAIHAGRAMAGPLVPLSCPLLTAELLQATVTRLPRGAREAGANQPALLLLDVDELPAEAQFELAGLLDLPGVEVPVLATAERGLFEAVEAGRFRRELAFRLGVLVIELPPLSARREDIPPLAQWFVERHNALGGSQLRGFSAEALEQLACHSWTGNVDELADCARQACRAAQGVWILPGDLPVRVRHQAAAAAHPPFQPESLEMDKLLAALEDELIERALRRAKGNKTLAAEMLGVTRARLHRRLESKGEAGEERDEE